MYIYIKTYMFVIMVMYILASSISKADVWIEPNAWHYLIFVVYDPVDAGIEEIDFFKDSYGNEEWRTEIPPAVTTRCDEKSIAINKSDRVFSQCIRFSCLLNERAVFRGSHKPPVCEDR